jgi:hypothetical protein
METRPTIITATGGSAPTPEEVAAAEALGRALADTPTTYGEGAALP